MLLSDIIKPENIIPQMRAKDRWEAIVELIEKLAQTQTINPEYKQDIVSAVFKRERSMSTGIGFGVGIPHASTPLVKEVVGAFGRSKDGINFDALDGQPVKLVMLILVPQGKFQEHLHTMAAIAKLLYKKEFRQSLEEAPDVDAIYEVLKSGLNG